jgi:hypothetical protein
LITALNPIAESDPANPGPLPIDLAITLLESGTAVSALAPWDPLDALRGRPGAPADHARRLELRTLLTKQDPRRPWAEPLDVEVARAQTVLMHRLRDPHPLTAPQWALARAVMRAGGRPSSSQARLRLARLFAKLMAQRPPPQLEDQAARLEALATGALVVSAGSESHREPFSVMAKQLVEAVGNEAGQRPTVQWWQLRATSVRALRLARSVVFSQNPGPSGE